MRPGSTGLFVDTSAWYELGDRSSRFTSAIARLVEEHKAAGLHTTTYVLAELCALVVKRVGHAEAASMGEAIRLSPDVEVHHPSAEEESLAWRLFLERPDKSYSLTDCLSFTIMRRQGLDTAVTLDDHFRQEGFAVLP